MGASRFNFRAWNSKGRTMINNVDLLFDSTGRATAAKDGHYITYSDDDIIMQSTGLVDKNGVEIFEGDVGKFNVTGDHPNEAHVGVIKWLDNYACYGLRYGEMKMVQFPAFPFVSGYEVIGNIHEHPHLMEGGKE